MEYKVFKSVFPREICEELIKSVPELSEDYDSFSGEILKRKQINHDWAYNFYRLSRPESEKYSKYILTVLPNVEVASFRVLHYPPGTKLGKHLDGPTLNGDNFSNSGFIVQLNDPRSYLGGHLLMDGNLIDLDIGDGVYYSYSVPHEVKLVRKSDRWISNIRLLS